MKSKFPLVALIGKYQTIASGTSAAYSRSVLEDIADFLHAQGCEVVLEYDTARNMGISDYRVLNVHAIGEQCDLGLVVGGDGTMLGIGRQLAHFGVPLIGINQAGSVSSRTSPWAHSRPRWRRCCVASSKKIIAA